MNDSLIAQLLNDYKKATDATSRDKKIKELLEKYLHENIIPEDVHLKYLLADFYFSIPEKYTENDESGTQYALNLLVDAAPSVWQAKTLLRIVEKGLSKDLDDVSAVYLLGYLYYTKGEKSGGESKQREKGIELLKKAAAEEHFSAAKLLSDYFCGSGIYTKESFEYTEIVYDHYNKLHIDDNSKYTDELATCAYRMGHFYEIVDIDEKSKDTDRAKMYYTEAQKCGHPEASKAIDNINNVPTRSDLKTMSDGMNQTVNNNAASIKEAVGNAISSAVSDINNNTNKESEEIQDGQKQIASELVGIKTEQENQGRKLGEIEKLVKTIPEETRKLIFTDLNKVTDEYKAYFDWFEQMHDQLEKGISDIKWTVDNTKHSVEELSAKMQEFYVKMEEQCVTQAKSTECASLREACEAELESLFGNYWTNGQLLESTKESLIAARVLLACAEHEELTDCRGIVISATSALERELKARFYTGARNYFKELNVWDGNDDSKLPRQLQENRKPGFTLAGIGHTLWLDHRDTSTNQYDYYDDTARNCYRSYLNDCIISKDIISGKTKYNNQIYLKNQPEYTFTENGRGFTRKVSFIADTYRNPAAHTQDTSRKTAKECCNSVIGIYSADVKDIESCLLDLLRLTEKFTHTI